jgi:Zn-dependent membrane protease YugP
MRYFSSFSDELQKIAEKVPLRGAAALYKALSKGAPVKVRVTKDAEPHGGGYFDPDKKEIALSKQNYETLAHELGHADLDKNLLGRLIQGRMSRIAGLSPLSMLGASLLMAKGHKWGVFLPAALAVPALASEAIASFKGNDLLKRVGASEDQRKEYGKKMVSAFSTYLVPPVMNTLLSALTRLRA